MNYLKKTPIWQDVGRLLLEVEKKVMCFPRYHKYVIGSEIRKCAMDICREINRAYKDKESKQDCVKKVNLLVDDLKVLLYISKEIKAFKNFVEFKEVSDILNSIGKQSGMWLKNLNAVRKYSKQNVQE